MMMMAQSHAHAHSLRPCLYTRALGKSGHKIVAFAQNSCPVRENFCPPPCLPLFSLISIYTLYQYSIVLLRLLIFDCLKSGHQREPVLLKINISYSLFWFLFFFFSPISFLAYGVRVPPSGYYDDKSIANKQFSSNTINSNTFPLHSSSFALVIIDDKFTRVEHVCEYRWLITTVVTSKRSMVV